MMLHDYYFLLMLSFLPLVTTLILIFCPSNFYKIIQFVSLASSLSSLILTLVLMLNFSVLNDKFQFFVAIYTFANINVTYSLGLDALSVWFVFLNSLLTFISIFYVSRYTINVRFFFILLFLIQFFVIQSFLVTDLFMFYVFFEAILIPMFLLIGVWGSYDRNLHAAFVFFLYTLAGSLIMLLAIQHIQSEVGSTYFYTIYQFNFSMYSQIFLFLAFFIAFAVKIPMFPVHVWLPEAHGEAPTIGSMILAGILLKLGVYGFARILLPICKDTLFLFLPFVFLLCLFGILYTSLSTLAQTDMKRIVAYSSVGHMNLAVLGLFSGTTIGFEGALFSVISHGFISPGLFMGVGLLYDRYGTKLINYYGNLVSVMPLLTIFMFLLSLGNLAFPGTSAFVGEFLIFTGVVGENFLLFLLSSASVIFVAIYTFWLFNRVFFGPCSTDLRNFSELTANEAFAFVILLVFMVLFGIYPSLVLDQLHNASMFVNS